MTSVSSEPVNKMPMKALGKPAIMISMAFRKMWPYSTRRSLKPFARAVTTYCLVISSRNEFLVRSVRPANPPITSEKMGSAKCQK